MAQKSYYQAETFDISSTALTYSSTNGAVFATAGVMQYMRLDYPTPGSASLNGDMSILWTKGSGTAPSAIMGLYAATATKLYLIGSTANFGSAATGLIRKAVTFTEPNAMLSPYNVLYAGYLLITDAGTNKTDVARSSTYATNYAFSTLIGADQTGGGQMLRCFTGAGTSLTALPATEAISGVTTAAYLPWVAVD